MKHYMELCRLGKESVPERSEMLAAQKELLLAQIKEIQDLYVAHLNAAGVNAIDLAITNNTSMFKAVSASANTSPRFMVSHNFTLTATMVASSVVWPALGILIS